MFVCKPAHMRFVALAILVTIYCVFSTSLLSAQGCSDAGICTIESFRPQTLTLPESNEIALGISYGSADNKIGVLGIQLSYHRDWNAKFKTSARLNAVNQSGNDISVFGPGDLFLTGEYQIANNFEGVLGVKIPLMQSDRKHEGTVLPMDYQSSLGTFDLLAGFHYQLNKFGFHLAYQHPLSQNRNTFLVDDLPVDTTLLYSSTNEFKRKGDLLLRISYPIFNDTKVAVTPNLQAVMHMGEDSYVEPGVGELPINGSSGLTINFNMTLAWKLARRDLLQFNVGFPVLVRKIRPEGLTRSFVASLDLRHSF